MRLGSSSLWSCWWRGWCRRYPLKIAEVFSFHNQRCRDGGRRFRAIAAPFDNYRNGQLWLFQRSDTQEPGVNAWVVLVQDNLIIFADNVPAIVFFHSVPRDDFAGFRIENGYYFLRRTSLAAGIDASRFDGGKHTARRATGTTSNESHDGTQLKRSLGRDHLIERLWRDVVLKLGFHQLAFQIADGRCRQGHLKGCHLSGIALSVSHQGQIVLGQLFACDNSRFARSQRFFDGVAAGIPDLRLLSAAQSLRRSVVRADT